MERDRLVIRASLMQGIPVALVLRAATRRASKTPSPSTNTATVAKKS
jgi:hypothetical protein